MPQMKVGSIDSMSIGFSIVDEDIKRANDRMVRYIKKVDLYEISLVTIPMNASAVITSMKSVVPFKDLPLPKNSDGEIDLDISWSSRDAIRRIREFTNSEDSPGSRYKNAFLWFDGENEDSFGSYKLPIADIVGGKMVAVPRAIFAAAAAMRGARGGVDIPESDREGVVANLNKYYLKMDRPSPLEKGFSPLIDNFHSMSDINFFIKMFGISNNETTSLVSAIKRLSEKEKSEKRNDDFISELKELTNILKK